MFWATLSYVKINTFIICYWMKSDVSLMYICYEKKDKATPFCSPKVAALRNKKKYFIII